MTTLKVWYHIDQQNFGDILTPCVLTHFNIPWTRTSIKCADIISIGSIVRRAPDNIGVYGSGAMFQKDYINTTAKYHFVRGPLTRQLIQAAGGTCPAIYGDPALLLPLFCKESTKQYDVGIIPHYVDYKTVVAKYPSYHVIDIVNSDPLKVAEEITKCRRIISSSLHGLIAAHAYGIPAAWVKFSKKVKGDGTKFKDHYACAGIEPVLSTVEDPVYQDVFVDTTKIVEIFKELAVCQRNQETPKG